MPNLLLSYYYFSALSDLPESPLHTNTGSCAKAYQHVHLCNLYRFKLWLAQFWCQGFETSYAHEDLVKSVQNTTAVKKHKHNRKNFQNGIMLIHTVSARILNLTSLNCQMVDFIE